MLLQTPLIFPGYAYSRNVANRTDLENAIPLSRFYSRVRRARARARTRFV